MVEKKFNLNTNVIFIVDLEEAELKKTYIFVINQAEYENGFTCSLT